MQSSYKYLSFESTTRLQRCGRGRYLLMYQKNNNTFFIIQFRWSKQKRQGGTILEPSNEDLELPDEQNEDLDAEMLAADIRVLAEEICMKWRENDWVAVMYEMKWYLGYIVEVF